MEERACVLDVRCVHVRNFETQIWRDLREQPAGAAVQVVARHYVIARRCNAQDSRECCHAAHKSERACGGLEVRNLGFEKRSGWIPTAAVVVSPTFRRRDLESSQAMLREPI